MYGFLRTPTPLFEPGWLERISADPALASSEIRRRALEGEQLHEKNRIEFLKLRTQRDELRKDVERHAIAYQGLQLKVANERRAARSSKAARVEAERLLDEYRERSNEEAKKAADMKCALSKEKDRVASLERRVRTLEQTVFVKARAQRDGTRLVSAIEKLAKSPAVGKRLAAACHPDKVPAECNDLAVELFRFVQGVRDSNSS